MGLVQDRVGLYKVEGTASKSKWFAELREASGDGVRIDPWGESDDLVVLYEGSGKADSSVLAASQITCEYADGKSVRVEDRLVHPEDNIPSQFPGIKITLRIPAAEMPKEDEDGKLRFRFKVASGWDLYDFWLQPALDQWEIDEGCVRPEYVVNSIAVYHKAKGGCNPKGFEYRKTGKACHIHRPFVRDSNGRFVWGAWEVEEKTQSLVKVFNPKDLQGADWYDVDADFGDTNGQGATGLSAIAGYCYWSARARPGAGNGTLDSISIYGAGTGAQKCELAIYTDASSLPSALGEQTAEITETNGSWVTGTADSAYALTDDGRYYWLAWFGEENWTSRYDSSAGGMKYKTGYTYPTWPSTVSSPTNLDRLVSIYASYTPSGGGGTPLTGAQVSSAVFSGTRPDVGLNLAGAQAAVASLSASQAVLKLGLSGSEQSVAALSGALSLYAPQISIQGAIVSGAAFSGSVGVFSSQKELTGALSAAAALNAGSMAVRLSLSGSEAAIARFAGALRVAGVTVALVWSARGESAGWGAYGEWYDPNATGTTPADESDGEVLN